MCATPLSCIEGKRINLHILHPFNPTEIHFQVTGSRTEEMRRHRLEEMGKANSPVSFLLFICFPSCYSPVSSCPLLHFHVSRFVFSPFVVSCRTSAYRLCLCLDSVYYKRYQQLYTKSFLTSPLCRVQVCVVTLALQTREEKPGDAHPLRSTPFGTLC